MRTNQRIMLRLAAVQQTTNCDEHAPQSGAKNSPTKRRLRSEQQGPAANRFVGATRTRVRAGKFRQSRQERVFLCLRHLAKGGDVHIDDRIGCVEISGQSRSTTNTRSTSSRSFGISIAPQSALPVKQLAPDQHAPNLVRSRAALVELRVAQDAPGRIFVDVAVAAERLDRVERDLHRAL